MAVKITEPIDPIKIKLNAHFDLTNNDDFFQFCADNPDINVERTQDGELVFMAPVGSDGSLNEEILSGELYLWNKEKKLGFVFSPSAGFTLKNNAMRSPDAAFIYKDKWTSLSKDQREKFAPICPDFVVEIRSQSDRLSLLQDKMLEWIENGAELAWLLDPLEEKAYIYRLNKRLEEIYSFDGQLSGENILPGFIFDLTLLKKEN